MKLSAPFIITPRLMPGLQFGQGDAAGWISFGYAKGPAYHAGRQCYEYIFDLPGGIEVSGDDLASGMGGGDLQSGFASLLCFLGAAIESRQYRGHTGRPEADPDSNEGLFPAAVLDWACEHVSEIEMAQLEIEETPGLIQE